MKKTTWIMFAVFCALASSEWLLPAISGGMRAVIYGSIGTIAAAINGRRQWLPWREAVGLAGASVLIVGVPFVINHWASAHLSSTSETVVLGFVPILMVLVVAQGGSENARSSLVPALAGLSGLLLLIPFSMPESWTGWASLVALAISAVMVTVGSVMTHRRLQEINIVQAIAIFCVSNVLVLLVSTRPLFEVNWTAAALVSIEILLLVGLLKGVSPIRLASRYLVIPGLTILEGFALLRPQLSGRMVVGAALLAGSSAWMLMAQHDDEQITLSLG